MFREKFPQFFLVRTLQRVFRNFLAVFVELKRRHRLNISVFGAWVIALLLYIALPEYHILVLGLHRIELGPEPLAWGTPRSCEIHDYYLVASFGKAFIEGTFVLEVINLFHWGFITLFHHFNSFIY